jgi:(1->4)-alpha-D-glucan 1-alpha-D-glucosylmutase
MPEAARAAQATYRVQLRPGFGFDEAAAIADYLEELGVSHLYSSPYLQAARGSTHGYDVVDPTRVNEELGGPEAHQRMCDALGQHNLGQVLDVVPNHMAITGRENAWWWDVLENGPSSVYAAYFDVDWDPPDQKLRNTVLLPILGDHYGRVLEAGQLHLEREDGSFIVTYYEHTAPIAPRSLDTLLEAAAERLPASRAGDEPDSRQQLESVANAFGRLPPAWATDRDSVRERHRDKEVLRARLADLCQHDPAVAHAIDQQVEAINRDPDQFDALLERQNFRLAWWRVASEQLDYRRFFDITSLIGLRVEDPNVFADSHALVLDFLSRGVLDGIRIDHIDGLWDPGRYLHRLAGAAPRAWIVVEKILEPGEELPDEWPVAGTTGYDWLNLANGLQIDPAGEEPLKDAYQSFTDEEPSDYDQIVHASKHQILQEALAADINRLTEVFDRVCNQHRRYRDFTRRDLYAALAEVAACFEVYRTYVSMNRQPPARPADVAYVTNAVDKAKQRRPDLDPELLDFLASVLLLRVDGDDEREVALRFQQLASPVMAKGVEDTTFYRYLLLLSLNEVGGDPGRFGRRPEDFHQACMDSQQRWPATMLATSTHDTKRSEDVRARINLLSEIPREWAETVGRWSNHNAVHGSPDRNTEWLLYQTLVGAWPIDTERLTGYLEKAIREAKTHTSWTDPVKEYESRVRGFAEGVMRDGWFLADLERVVGQLERPGWVNSLAMKLLTLTGPGSGDIYQGTELWDLSLVDPDNRRPVDFGLRRRLLASLRGADPATVWAEENGSGLSKLLLVNRALKARRARVSCFGSREAGAYRALSAEGSAIDHVVAFARGGGVVTVVPRLVLGLERRGGWGDTTLSLPDGEWCDELGDPTRVWSSDVELGQLLHGFPVALLTKVGS